MATTEKDILMNKKSNGNTDILYPITKMKNVIDEDGNTLVSIIGDIQTLLEVI